MPNDHDESYHFHPRNIVARLERASGAGQFHIDVRLPSGNDSCGLVTVTVKRDFWPPDDLLHDWHALAGELGCGIDFVEVDDLPPRQHSGNGWNPAFASVQLGSLN